MGQVTSSEALRAPYSGSDRAVIARRDQLLPFRQRIGDLQRASPQLAPSRRDPGRGSASGWWSPIANTRGMSETASAVEVRSESVLTLTVSGTRSAKRKNNGCPSRAPGLTTRDYLTPHLTPLENREGVTLPLKPPRTPSIRSRFSHEA